MKYFLTLHHNDPKFSGRQVLANHADPDQTGPEPWGAVWSGSTLFAIPSASFGRINSMVKPTCSNFRVITANFLGVRIFRIIMVYCYLQLVVKMVINILKNRHIFLSFLNRLYRIYTQLLF